MHAPDERLESLLADPRYDLCVDDLKRAIQILSKKPREDLVSDARVVADVVAKRAAIPAFFSYRHRHARAAETIRSTLVGLFRDRVDLRWDQEFATGAKLIAQIRDRILPAHWFILLLPDPSEEWDWPLFESGIFSAKLESDDVLRRVFILHHHENQRPNQFEDLLTIPAKPNDPSAVSDFLMKVCTSKDFYPGVSQLCPVTRDEIQKAAEAINRAIVPPERLIVRTEHCEAFLKLQLPRVSEIELSSETPPERCAELLESDGCQEEPDSPDGRWQLERIVRRRNFELLDGASILEANPACCELFGLRTQPTHWKDLVARVATPGTDKRWLAEICVAMRGSFEGRRVEDVISATFQSARRDRASYRPVLFAVEAPAGPRLRIDTFHLLFIEDVSAVTRHAQVLDPAPGYVQISSSMRQSRRFAWEMVAPFKNLTTLEELEQLKTSLERIMKDYTSRGGHRLDRLSALFGGEKERVDQLYEILVLTLGQLQQLIKDRDIPGVRKVLAEFEPHNLEYLRLASEWFAEKNRELERAAKAGMA